MRKLSILVLGLVLVLVSSNSFAGGYRHGYYGHGPYGYGGYGYRHGYRRHHGHGQVAGTLIVGALLGYAISSSTRPAYVVERRPVYRARVSGYRRQDYGDYGGSRYVPGSYSRYYLRDADGNCYLVNVYDNGDENWTAVPAVNCR